MPAPTVNTLSYSSTVGTSATQVFQGIPRSQNGLSYYMIWNVSPSGGPTIWVSRSTVTPTVNGAGCFPLLPGSYQEFKLPSAIPANAVYAIATAAGANLYVEIG